MKSLIKEVIVFSLCMLLAGCGASTDPVNAESQSANKTASDKTGVAMGRYVEETAGLEAFIEDKGDACLTVNAKGNLQAFLSNEQFECCQLNDAEEWQKVESALCDTLNNQHPEIKSIINIQAREEEESYFLFGDKQNGENDVTFYFATFEGGQLNEINIDLKMITLLF